MLFQSQICQDLDFEGGKIMRLAKTVARRYNGLPLALEIIRLSMIDATVLICRKTKKKSPQIPSTSERQGGIVPVEVQL